MEVNNRLFQTLGFMSSVYLYNYLTNLLNSIMLFLLKTDRGAYH